MAIAHQDSGTEGTTQTRALNGIRERIPTSREGRIGSSVVRHGGGKTFSNRPKDMQTQGMSGQAREAGPAPATGQEKQKERPGGESVSRRGAHIEAQIKQEL